MTWFKVDDSFYDHPKVFDAPDCAVALWVRAGCWAARNLTDGFIPAKLPQRLCDDPETAIEELVARGLWERVEANASSNDEANASGGASGGAGAGSVHGLNGARRSLPGGGGGYRFLDWSDYQPSAEKVRETRAKRAEAGRKGGVASGNTRRAASSNDEANASGGASDVSKQKRTPTRPDPGASKEAPSGANKSRTERGRGTRIPVPFPVTDELRSWFKTNCPDVDGRYEHEQFQAYWQAKTGSNATKIDWNATWQWWMRKAQKGAAERIARRGPELTARRVDVTEERCRDHPTEPALHCLLCDSEQRGG